MPISNTNKFQQKNNEYLSIVLEVVVQDHGADFEISGVEWVASVPALWPKLPPLCDNCVEVAEGEEDALELCLLRAHLQSVLVKVVQCFVQIGKHACKNILNFNKNPKKMMIKQKEYCSQLSKICLNYKWKKLPR